MINNKFQIDFSNLTIKTICLLAVFFFIGRSQGQVSESCECTIDTAGYASFVTTLTVADIPMQFHVHNNFAVAIGYITTTTPTTVQNLINTHPNVTVIVLLDSGGSEDDQANLQASQLLRNAGYNMYVPSNGTIASGAVDMFFSGVKRIIDPGAQIGVHSWSDGVNDATFYPVGHAFHQPYIDYYVNMGLTQQESEDFYYFTINAAPAAGIHWMTEAEIDQYKLRTCKYSANPTYTVSVNGNTLQADLAGATSYQWVDCDNGNAPIAGATNQSFTPSSNGNFAVEIQEQGCSGTSACAAIQLSSLTENEALGIQVYPNPTEKTLSVLGLAGNETISVLTTNGHVLKKISPQDTHTDLDISSLPSGFYLLSIAQSNGNTYWIRWIKA